VRRAQEAKGVTMKIRVEGRNGEKQTITLVPPITNFSDSERLSSFRCGDGTDHYFTSEGFYDGWGRAVNMSMEEAVKEIDRKLEDQE